MPEPQSFKNHSRLDPPQHFIAAPILMLNLLACIGMTIKIAISPEPRMLGLHLWLTIVSFALLVAVVNMRLKDLRIQDRLIRLEERVRYAALLPPPELTATSALTLSQIVALRFAPDAELPALLKRTVAENLTSKQIKESIVNWRTDDLRV